MQVQHDSHAIDIQVVNNLFVITRLQANPPYNTESYTYRWDDAKTPYGNTEIVLMSPYADLRNTVQRYTGMHETLFLRTNGTVVRRRMAPDNSGAHQDVMTFPRDRHGFPARIIAVSEHAAIAEGDLLPPAAILDDM
jgi:hypothetical protein